MATIKKKTKKATKKAPVEMPELSPEEEAATGLLTSTSPEPVVEKMREPKVVWKDPPPVEKVRDPKRLSVLPDGSAEVLLEGGKMVTLPAEMVQAIAKLA